MSLADPGRLAARALGCAAALVVLPGAAAAQQLDPSVVVEASTPVRATGSFVLVLVFGAALVFLSEEFVERSVDDSMDAPLRSLGYGFAAQVIVVFFGFYAVSQLSRLGGPVVDIAGVAFGVFVLTLAGLGFVVVGARVTEVVGERRLRPGAAVGALLSAAAWLAPSFALGLFVWLLVASLGIGGPTERWLHASRSIDDGTVEN